MADKAGIDEMEKSPIGTTQHLGGEKVARQGDVALAVIGDERVSLSEEDVSLPVPPTSEPCGLVSDA